MAGQGNFQTQPFNVNTAAAQGLRGAMGTTAMGMGYTPQSLASAGNIAQYQNPYTQQVIDASTQDILLLSFGLLCLLLDQPRLFSIY